MKTKLLVFVMLTSVFSLFGQANLLDTMNADFEKGSTELWRAVEVRDGAAYFFNDTNQESGALSSVVMSDDSNGGDYAAAFTWAADPLMADLVFDYWDTPMPCLAETDYIFKAFGMATAGAGILRMNMTFFDGDSGLVNGVIVGDYADQTWVLGGFYEEHVWTQPSPVGAKSVIIGFRVLHEDGSRWPAENVTTLIDDVRLFEGVDATGVDDRSADLGIGIYPNPASDRLHIKSEIVIRSLSIYNISGQLMKEVSVNFDNINIEGLATGMYFISMETDLGNNTQKLIVK